MDQDYTYLCLSYTLITVNPPRWKVEKTQDDDECQKTMGGAEFGFRNNLGTDIEYLIDHIGIAQGMNRNGIFS